MSGIHRKHVQVLKDTKHLHDKVVWGGSNSSFAMRNMAKREVEENAHLYKEAKEQRIQARVRNAFLCKCGKRKQPQYRECYDCLMDRRKRVQTEP